MCVGGSHAGEIRDRTWKRAGSQKQDLRTGLLAPLHGSPIEHRGLRSLLDARLLCLRQIGLLSSSLIGRKGISKRASLGLPDAALDTLEIMPS